MGSTVQDNGTDKGGPASESFVTSHCTVSGKCKTMRVPPTSSLFHVVRDCSMIQNVEKKEIAIHSEERDGGTQVQR